MNESLKKQFTLTALGDPIIVLIRESAKAKNIAIRCNHQKIELVLPIDACKDNALKFLLSKEQSIREYLKSNPINSLDNKKVYKRIPILGEIHNIKYIKTSNSFAVEISDKVIIVYSPKNNATEVLIRFLKDYALAEITSLIKNIVKRHKIKYQKITVEDFDNNWGSYSPLGNLSFNWRIIFAPILVLHYLVVHELCYLKEPTNEAKYWDLIAKISPDYQISQLWLTKYGNDLYTYLI